MLKYLIKMYMLHKLRLNERLHIITWIVSRNSGRHLMKIVTLGVMLFLLTFSAQSTLNS